MSKKEIEARLISDHMRAMMRAALILAAVTPLALADYSYSYGPSPTPAPTATAAPTRTGTYAPTRMTEAPSYAPTTDTYAPTLGSCPQLVPDPDTCPADPSGLPLCSAIGLATGDKCITGPQICPRPCASRRRAASRAKTTTTTTTTV